MTDTILVAVSDSPAAFTAAEAAIEQARRLGARLHVLTVIPDGDLGRRMGDLDRATSRREAGADAVLRHVTALCRSAGVPVTSVRRHGRVAVEILAEAREVGASMIVMARVDRPGHAIPSLGSHTLRVLEFAAVPVLVVPGT